LNRRLTIRIIIIALAVIAAIIVGILLYRSGNKTFDDYRATLSGFNSDENLAVALEALEKSDEMASIIKKIDTSERIAALTLDGMLSEEQMEEIMEILQANEIEATFFTEGILAAEEDAVLTTILKNGFGIGNYTLYGNKYMEIQTQEEQVEDFVKSKNIIDTLTNQDIKILKCNVTDYTKELRNAAKCSGFEQIVESSVMLSSKSFSSRDAAVSYVQKIKSGSIISVKLSEELSEEEYQVDDTPAKDLKPSLDEEEEEEIEEVDIIQMITFLAEALRESGIKMVLVEELPDYHDADYDKKYSELEDMVGGELADVFTSIPVGSDWVGCSLKGIRNEEMLDKVLELLEETNSHATFFVSGNDVLKYEDRIQKIIKKGHTIENGGYTGASMVDQSFTDTYLEIEGAKKLIKEKFGITTQLYMPAYGKYDDTMRKAAKSLDTVIVTYNKNPITDKEKDPEEIMEYFEKGLKKGDIIYFDMDYYEELPAVMESVIELANNQNLSIVSTTIMFRNKLDIVKLVIGQVKGDTGFINTKYQSGQKDSPSSGGGSDDTENDNTDEELINRLKGLQDENAGKLADVMNDIHIVKDAVVFTFYDISNEVVLNDITGRLKKRNAAATFFVSEEEAEKYPDRIRSLMEAGHEIGIVVYPKQDQTFETVSMQIYKTDLKLKELGVRAEYVFQPWGQQSDVIRESVSALGFQLAGYDLGITKEVHINYKSEKKVVSELFPSSVVSLHQGEILFFRLNYYSDDSLTGKVMEEIIKQKLDNIKYTPTSSSLKATGTKYNGYSIMSLGGLMSDKKSMYQYPLANSSKLDSVKGKIYPGQFSGDIMEEMRKRYIGNPDVNGPNTLYEFSNEEIEALDKSGSIRTDDNVIFLTFDDWGSDAAVNKLLYVMEKHNVKATFFTRTNYVELNPNLLRKISLAGHSIASHTNAHIPLPNVSPGDLKTDLVTAYQRMEDIIGDVEVDGRASLTTWFRPPTLALNKEGVRTAFDVGHDYFVCGTYSTHDYEAKSAQALYQSISANIVDDSGNLIKGSIIIMHFSDSSKFTAEALDILLTENNKKSSSDPSKFRVGNLADYLTWNYEQTQPVESSEEDNILVEFSAIEFEVKEQFEETKITEEDEAVYETIVNESAAEESADYIAQEIEEEILIEEQVEYEIPAEEFEIEAELSDEIEIIQ